MNDFSYKSWTKRALDVPLSVSDVHAATLDSYMVTQRALGRQLLDNLTKQFGPAGARKPDTQDIYRILREILCKIVCDRVFESAGLPARDALNMLAGRCLKYWLKAKKAGTEPNLDLLTQSLVFTGSAVSWTKDGLHLSKVPGYILKVLRPLLQDNWQPVPMRIRKVTLIRTIPKKREPLGAPSLWSMRILLYVDSQKTFEDLVPLMFSVALLQNQRTARPAAADTPELLALATSQPDLPDQPADSDMKAFSAPPPPPPPQSPKPAPQQTPVAVETPPAQPMDTAANKICDMLQTEAMDMFLRGDGRAALLRRLYRRAAGLCVDGTDHETVFEELPDQLVDTQQSA